MSYAVQTLYAGSTLWTNASSGHGTEQQAIFHAKSVVSRPRVTKVRVINRSGSVVWIS